MIKLKMILKESKYAWDRKFGDPLPTFKDIAETHQNKPKEQITEESLPKFQSLKEVPKFGITVGLGTIHKLSRKAILVLSGKEKRKAADVILSKKLFNKQKESININIRNRIIMIIMLMLS